jgi:hypothetical protein
MDRKMLQEHLEAAERHVAQGREHIAHQCELIAELERDGHHQAAAKAASMLETYMELQGLHEEDRDRLLNALGEDPPTTAHRAWQERDRLTAEHCRSSVKSCRVAAETASNERAKDHWVRAAENWARLAGRLEKKPGR